MNIENELDPTLWEFIKRSYETNNYTGAILDSIYFISDIIRERSGLESDGVQLIGDALGGKDPLLKVNKLQSDSDWNIQRGSEQIFRGIIQAIRNPRSHKKYSDTKETADAIIIFIDYLFRIIQESKTPFTKETFLKRVFDKDFVETDEYAKLLVKEIPPKQRYDIFIDVYRQKEKANLSKLRFFIHAILRRLNREEIINILNIVSDDLKNSNEDATIRSIIKIFPKSYWKNYDKAARLRIENKLINSIREGKYDKDSETCRIGALGTWIINVLDYFSMKDELLQAIINKLNSDDSEDLDYVFNYLFYYLPKLSDPPWPGLVLAIKKGLNNGDKRFYGSLSRIMTHGPESWKKAFGESYVSFHEKEDEDIPF